MYRSTISSTYVPAVHLAIHFLELERAPDDKLKSIVLLGSMSRLAAHLTSFTGFLTQEQRLGKPRLKVPYTLRQSLGC